MNKMLHDSTTPVYGDRILYRIDEYDHWRPGVIIGAAFGAASFDVRGDNGEELRGLGRDSVKLLGRDSVKLLGRDNVKLLGRDSVKLEE